MKQGEIKETEGTFITPTGKVGVIKVPSKVKKSQYLISTYTNNPTSAIQTAPFGTTIHFPEGLENTPFK